MKMEIDYLLDEQKNIYSELKEKFEEEEQNII